MAQLTNKSPDSDNQNLLICFIVIGVTLYLFNGNSSPMPFGGFGVSNSLYTNNWALSAITVAFTWVLLASSLPGNFLSNRIGQILKGIFPALSILLLLSGIWSQVLARRNPQTPPMPPAPVTPVPTLMNPNIPPPRSNQTMIPTMPPSVGGRPPIPPQAPQGLRPGVPRAE